MIEIVAWWGAILSTLVFAWDVVKWRMAGPQLRLTVNSGMQSMNIPAYEGKTLIMAYLVNYGDRPTTLTHMALLQYASAWKRLRNKAQKTLLIMNPNLDQRLPYELKPGRTWMGIAVQNDEIEAMANNGHLVCAIYHSHRNRPVRKRVTVLPSQKS